MYFTEKWQMYYTRKYLMCFNRKCRLYLVRWGICIGWWV